MIDGGSPVRDNYRLLEALIAVYRLKIFDPIEIVLWKNVHKKQLAQLLIAFGFRLYLCCRGIIGALPLNLINFIMIYWVEVSSLLKHMYTIKPRGWCADHVGIY